jgi:hypothetical protein
MPAIALLIAGCLPPGPVKTVSHNDLARILSVPLSEWDLKACDNVVAAFTWYNEEGYVEKQIAPGTKSDADVFITATPLNRYVVQARLKKEAIIRRWPDAQCTRRLQAELEYYTNWTLIPESHTIVEKTSPGDSLRDEVTFLIRFENISRPYRTVEMFRVEEGVFLENQVGDFTRVIAVGGRDHAEDFFLVNDLSMELTFSLITDGGKKLNLPETPSSDFRLVFNGLEAKPVTVVWHGRPPF